MSEININETRLSTKTSLKKYLIYKLISIMVYIIYWYEPILEILHEITHWSLHAVNKGQGTKNLDTETEMTRLYFKCIQ